MLSSGSFGFAKKDARGDVFRGLEVVEQACGVGAAMMGETLSGVAKGMDTHSYREPLGVCAGEFRTAVAYIGGFYVLDTH